MTLLPYVTTITIPSWRVPNVQHLLDEITKEKGGCTRTAGTGEWLDSAGVNHMEGVSVFSWHSDETGAEFLAPLIERLLMLGEEAILYTHTTVPARIVTLKDYPTFH